MTPELLSTQRTATAAAQGACPGTRLPLAARRIPALLVLLCAVLSALALPCARGANADLAVLERITGLDTPEAMSLQFLITNAWHNDQWAAFAKDRAADETQRLGQNKTDWNPGNPRWQPVFDRIMADLGAELDPFKGPMGPQSPRWKQRYLTEVAGHLAVEDVATILAYYGTPEGQRYEAFMRRNDKLMGRGVPIFLDPSRMPHQGEPPAGLQERDAMLMLEMFSVCHPLLAAEAARTRSTFLAPQANQRPPEGFETLGYLAYVPVSVDPAEAVAIFGEYRNDLQTFAAFQKTNAAQDLVNAMAAAIITFPPPAASDYAQVMAAIRRKHEAQWQALYRGGER